MLKLQTVMCVDTEIIFLHTNFIFELINYCAVYVNAWPSVIDGLAVLVKKNLKIL